MATIRKKLREAMFFFRHLSNEKNALDPEAEEFEFFLSAFLTAGRSVTEIFYKDCRGWFHNWRMALDDSDRRFLNDMSHQRNLEVHAGGSALRDSSESGLVGEISQPIQNLVFDFGCERGVTFEL